MYEGGIVIPEGPLKFGNVVGVLIGALPIGRCPVLSDTVTDGAVPLPPAKVGNVPVFIGALPPPSGVPDGVLGVVTGGVVIEGTCGTPSGIVIGGNFIPPSAAPGVSTVPSPNCPS